MPLDDSLAKILHLDLTRKSFRVESRPELFEKAIGGAGAAIGLLLEETPEGCDPLSPENPIILAVGPLTGLFPMASKTVAMFKSPHTGDLGESHCGGRSAVAIRMAGYGAIVIKGASERPVYISIHGDKVRFRDASSLWGMRSSSTAARIIRQREPGAGLRTIMRIGAAGERLVSYSAVTTETYRHFGRLGLGAVFGSKKLKAVVVSGKRSIPVASGKDYRDLYDEIHQDAVSSDLMRKYHDLGTAGNILPLNEMGGLPTRNLKAARFEGAEQISGERLAREYLGRRLACAHCPVGCIHLAALREPYPGEAYFYKTSMISYDYELIYALGSMLGIDDPRGLLRLLDEIERLGLDAMSAGVVLAWATEALEKGLIGERETMGVRLCFGEAEAYIEASRSIVDGGNEFYRTLGRGVEAAAGRYGGADFALCFHGNEAPGYHTGPAAYIGYLIGARHSHLDNAGYGLDQKALGKGLPSPEDLVDELVSEERRRQILSSLVICFFARKVYSLEVIARALEVAGAECRAEDLGRIGDVILKRKYDFKLREGFHPDDVRLPGRIFETPSPLGAVDREYVGRALSRFRRIIE